MFIKDIDPGIVLVHGDCCSTVEADRPTVAPSQIPAFPYNEWRVFGWACVPVVLGHIVPPCCLVDYRVATTAAYANPGATGECASSAEPGGGQCIYPPAGFSKFCHTVTVIGNDLKNIIIYIYTVRHKIEKQLRGCYC